MSQTTFVVSDLHLGGVPATKPDERGFRMCHQTGVLAELIRSVSTIPSAELVINGDFVDFLAERNDDGQWTPTQTPSEAVRKLDLIAKDRPDREVFEALRMLIADGKRLVLLLGNHDIELALPEARRHLVKLLCGNKAGDLHFVFDGEAYPAGNALIEHGNRYDGFNVVDHNSFRELRSLQSRRLPDPDGATFDPPIGSKLVASIMNPLKESYPFIDLLKPENEAVVPILLALEPSCRSRLLEILRLKLRAQGHEPRAPGVPSRRSEISAHVNEMSAEDMLLTILAEGSEGDVLAEASPIVRRRSISAGRSQWLGGLASLLLSGGSLDHRLKPLLRALRTLQFEKSFALDADPSKYPAHAEAIALGGFRYVVFGHTHLAKDVLLPSGGRYLNTGTWSDLIKLPDIIFTDDEAAALEGLRTFVSALVTEDRSHWVHRRPTYVRIEHDGSDSRASLHEYHGGMP